jgi:hypothetical protein
MKALKLSRVVYVTVYLAALAAMARGQKSPLAADADSSCRDGHVAPRLFIIGAQKGGTSSLYAELASVGKGLVSSSSCSTTQNDQKECNVFTAHTVRVHLCS